ncbi:hypothetical protein OPV22_005210 [Ensete ventricosum]|uniref:Uncharacterized protein n=1 Tax=Ensete ventricosum TaxID=4639 RepID=A0AAV8RKI0_ENSVE|nr:hypothetical protein OPV22_005210 [Ensete ventricosum]
MVGFLMNLVGYVEDKAAASPFDLPTRDLGLHTPLHQALERLPSLGGSVGKGVVLGGGNITIQQFYGAKATCDGSHAKDEPFFNWLSSLWCTPWGEGM